MTSSITPRKALATSASRWLMPVRGLAVVLAEAQVEVGEVGEFHE